MLQVMHQMRSQTKFEKTSARQMIFKSVLLTLKCPKAKDDPQDFTTSATGCFSKRE